VLGGLRGIYLFACYSSDKKFIRWEIAGAGAAMQQVADWLERLGLRQYAQRFAENDISFVILPDLTDQDLEKIWVSRLSQL
jgi:SAM domain (Sterile alpha motif)